MSKKEKKEMLELNDNNELSTDETSSRNSSLTPDETNDFLNKKKYEYIIKRKSVRNKTRRRTASLIMVVFVMVALLITSVVYGVLAFVDFNSFRITIDRNYNGYLTLSDRYDFENASSVLSTDGLKNMTNTTYSWINIKELLNKEGSLSKNDYIATAFYLKNQGEKGVFYSENITITNSYKQLEDTIRILLIKQIETTAEDGTVSWSAPEYKCFGKVASDGISDEYVAGGDDVIPDYVSNPNYPNQNIPWKCTSFYDSDSGIVTDTIYYPLLPNQKVRYAMAIWIEGTDPDTLDDKIGGRVSYTFQFSLRSEDGKVIFIE